MEISRVKLPCVPNGGKSATFCTVLYVTSRYRKADTNRTKRPIKIGYFNDSNETKRIFCPLSASQDIILTLFSQEIVFDIVWET